VLLVFYGQFRFKDEEDLEGSDEFDEITMPETDVDCKPDTDLLPVRLFFFSSFMISAAVSATSMHLSLQVDSPLPTGSAGHL